MIVGRPVLVPEGVVIHLLLASAPNESEKQVRVQQNQ